MRSDRGESEILDCPLLKLSVGVAKVVVGVENLGEFSFLLF